VQPYPTLSEIKQVHLQSGPLQAWIDTHFLRGDPFAFRNLDFRPIARFIATNLDTEPNGVFCAGSGAMGWSLNPKKVTGDGKLKAFDSGSDLDIAIVSAPHFETAWRDLRRSTQPTIVPRAKLRRNISWQRDRLFDGVIVATHVLNDLSFGQEWTKALVRIGQEIDTTLGAHHKANLWIYRDYWGLRNYVAAGFVSCRKKM
jgi:hypothetical protein